MSPEPKFRSYPLYHEPRYLNWFVVGALLLAVAYNGVLWPLWELFRDELVRLVLSIIVSALWLSLFLLRVLIYILHWHSSQGFEKSVREVEDEWWARHRQKAALVEAVLVGGGCSTPEHREKLFSADHLPAVPESAPEGASLRSLQVFGPDVDERERQLAMLMVLQWQAQRTEPAELQPLASYWQGSLSAWQVFVAQMAKSFPLVQLPDQPEVWEGIASLDSIIDQLQDKPSNTRILCAGCQSSPTRPDSRLPAGEAAVLWLLGPDGGVHFSRGEWFDVETEHLPTVAERAMQQSALKDSPEVCVSFSQSDVPSPAAHDWPIKQNRQDANFGDLENLEGMVVLTLAAWYAKQHQVPCAWLANDPLQTLAIGMVVPHDSTH